ncbi:hypothetical protein [Streptomyces tsukubensis]|uniref:Uncharacterized protein n=1 Tax=Streptomyces tsukubensis TaxID=83656 RepID=A0A1V4AH03_9ACTN|nr:hypothetical protein [Streptomyces tsukubensis]OON82723.1 hypothetical protein B1H18_01380 [Streptomyces tsukubensis]QFR92101.1 hypothetical protein GBW32_02300 [Streptomyces tsukubensis]
MTHHTGSLGRYEVRLLLWLHGQCARQVDVPVPTGEFGLQQNKPALGVAALIETLQERGLVRIQEDGEQPPPDAELTTAGLAQADRLVAELGDPDAIRRHTENALIAWAYEENRSGRHPRLKEFYIAEQASFHGRVPGQSVVEGSADYLQQVRLLTLDGEAIAARVELTDRGRICATSGEGDVSAYVARAQAPPNLTINSVTGNVNVMGTVDTFNQQTGLNLDPEQIGQLIQADWDLRNHGGSTPPTPQTRSLAARIRAQLASAPNSTAAQALMQTIGPILTRLLGG